MKRFVWAVFTLALLTGCKTEGEKLLVELDKRPEVGMLIVNHGEKHAYNAPFVTDLLNLTANAPEQLQGATVADRRVGKAAACLLITGGVKAVYTPLVSTPAREMLENAGVTIVAKKEIPLMLNNDGSDLCPMERKLLELNEPAECAMVLRGSSVEGIQMLNMLNQQGLSLLVYNDSTLTTHANRGVQDLLQLIAEQPERLKGAIVADKLIGKAAAALMAAGGVKEVHTNIICTAAYELLQQEGVKVFAREQVPQILNRDRSAMCPIDAQLTQVESVEECVNILRNMPARL